MKRSRLLIPTIPLVMAMPLISCGGSGPSPAERVAEAIYKPTEIEGSVTPKPTFKDELAEMSQEDIENEVLYDLFGFFNLNNWMDLQDDKSFISLYRKDNPAVALQASLPRFEIENKLKDEEHALIVTVYGFVTMAFLTDYVVEEGDETKTIYEKGDFVQITYSMWNTEVTIDNSNCSLTYSPKNKNPDACIGIIQQMKVGEGNIYYIKSLNTYTEYKAKQTNLPSNSKNFALA